MIVILDNGHGHNTRGKRSPKGMLTDAGQTALYEFEFNRDIVKRVIKSLDYAKINYIELVPEASDIGLKERCERVNSIAKNHPECFLVSVHANAGGGTGWEVFTSVGETESDSIAEVFAKKAKQLFPEFRMRFDKSDSDLDKEIQFYILRNTVCPAILTENFFMDTEKDLALLISDEGRQRIADLHTESIIEILER